MTDLLKEIMQCASAHCDEGNVATGVVLGRAADKIEALQKENAALRERLDTALSESLTEILKRQKAFSYVAFGPNKRTKGIIDHIKKELAEIEQAPTDVSEWCDVVLLALDGAWRAGHEPEAIAEALEAKLSKNEKRSWPDWRRLSEHKAIEHLKGDHDAD